MTEDFGQDNRISWDHYFLNMSYNISRKSRDPSTQVGAVIVAPDNQVVSQGYNGFPRGVENTEARWTIRPDKYNFIVHAERNAIYNAARQGKATEGCTMYLFYNCCPCEQCTLAVIQAGITEVVLGTSPFPGVGKGQWYDTDGDSPTMLNESKVNIRQVTDWSEPNAS
jgi:dCMP deaminase